MVHSEWTHNIDDIQVGVGRVGTFFSFEEAGIVPDIVLLSKTISGIGTPLSLVLFQKELDVFEPAEHNGTFHGNQLGFDARQAAIEFFVSSDLTAQVATKENIIRKALEKLVTQTDAPLQVRGKGMIWGIDFSELDSSLAKKAQKECMERQLIIECAGTRDAVLKIISPITIEIDYFQEGLSILSEAIKAVLHSTEKVDEV